MWPRRAQLLVSRRTLPAAILHGSTVTQSKGTSRSRPSCTCWPSSRRWSASPLPACQGALPGSSWRAHRPIRSKSWPSTPTVPGGRLLEEWPSSAIVVVLTLVWVLPCGSGLEHGVQGNEHSAHEGRECKLGWLSIGGELAVAGLQRALVGLEAGEDGHAEGVAGVTAAALENATVLAQAAV